MTVRENAVGVALAVLVATPGLVPAQQVVYTGSVNYATGDYIFTERTNSLYLFNGIGLSTSVFGISFNWPLIYQTTPWVSYSAVGGIPSGDSPDSTPGSGGSGGSGNRTDGRSGPDATLDAGTLVLAEEPVQSDTALSSNFGIGDPNLHADVFIVREGETRPAVQLSADVKFPLADVDRGFGTGAWDFGAGLNVSKGIGRAFLTAGVAYWILGDMPDQELKNNIGYGFSAGWLPGNRIAAVFSLAGYTRIIEGTDPPLQLSLVGSYLFSARRSLSASVGLGLTESSPDLSLAVGWRLGL